MHRDLYGTPRGFIQRNGKLYDVRQAIEDRRVELIKEINQESARRAAQRGRSSDSDLDDDEDVVQSITNKDVTTSDDQITKEPNKTEEQQDKKPNDQSTNVVEQDSQTTSQVGNVIKKVRKTPTLDELGSNVSVVLENMYNGFKAGRVSEDAITSFIDRIADPKRHQNDKSIFGTANEAVNRALGISDDINKLRNDGALDALRSFIETVDDDVKTSIQSGGINGAIRASSLNRLANKAKVATSSVAGNVDLSNATASASRSEAAAAIDDIQSRAKFAEDEINSVCEQYGIRDYQSLIDTYNNLDKPMRDRNGNMLPSINEAISNIHRAKDEFDGITSGEIQLPANVDKEAYLKELKRVGAANLEYIANASQQFGSYQNVMSFKSAFDKIQATRAEDERAMDVYNQVYGNIFKIDAEKIKRSQEGADTGITLQTPGEIPTSTAQYMNRAASNPTFGLRDGAIVNNNIANLYAYRSDVTNPLIKYYNTQITRSGIAREKERVMQQKAENNNIRLKQFAKTRGIPVDQLSDREKYYATHFDFDETPNWFETVAVSSFNGDRTINGVDTANDIGEVKQSDLDASYTESEALNRQMEYLDKADILSSDESTLSKMGSSIKNYAWDHLSTFASNSLLFGAQKYWDEGVGEIISKQNRGEALSYSEKRALEAEYNKQRLLSYGESLKNNQIANMDGANVYDLTNAGVDMLQFSLPIVGVNWLGRGVTFLGKGIRATNTAKNASEGISKGAKIWNATRNVTGYTVEVAGRTLSMDLYDPAKRLTYKSLVKAGAAKAAPTATRAAGVAAGSMAHMGSIIGGTAVEANTIGLGMWKEEFNRYAAGYLYAQKNAEGDIEYGRVSMKDAFGNDIDTEEEYDRMATNQVLGEFGSEKTGLYFDKIMNAVIKKSGFSFLSKNMFANIARKLSKVTGGTTTGYIGEGLEEVLNNTWGGFTGLMKWDEVTDPGQNLQMASHLLVAMLQQGVVVSALGSVKDKASIYRMTNRQINEARDILKEQFLKANANNPEAEKIFNQKYENAVQIIKQNIKTSQSLFNDNIDITDENKDYGFGTKNLLELFGLNKDKSEFTAEDKVMMSALSQFVGVYTVGHMSNEALSNTIINNLTTVKGRGWNQLIASTGGRLRKNNRGRTHTLIIPDENGNDIDTGIEFSVDKNGNATPVNTDDAKSGLALNLGSVFINKKDGTYKSFNDETKKKLNSYRDYFITQRNALVKNAFIYQTLAKTGRLNNVLSKVDDRVESSKVSLIRAKIGNFFNPDKYEKFNKYNDSEYINASEADKEALRHIQSEAQYVKNFASVAAIAIQNDKFGSLFKAMGAETEFEKQSLLANIFANERLKDMYSHDMFVARSSIAERIFGDKAISDTVDEIYKSVVDEAKQLLPTASDTEIGRLNELINGLNGSSDEKIKSAIKSIIVDRLLQSRSLANLYGGLGFMQMMRAQLDGKAKDKLKYMGFPVFDKIEFNLDSAIDNLIKRAVKNDKSDVRYADLVAQYANAYVNDAIIRGSMTGDKSLNEVLSELYKSGFITDADIMSSAKTRMKSMFRVSEESTETFADFINELARDLGYTRDNKNEEGELSLLYNKILSSTFDNSLGLTRETILKVFNEIDLDKVNDDVAKLIRLIRDNIKEGAEHYNTTLDTVDRFVRNLGDNIDRINKEQADHNKAVLDKMVRQATKFNNTIESDNVVDPTDPSAEPSDNVDTNDEKKIPVAPGRTDTDGEEGGGNNGDENGGEGGEGNPGDGDNDNERNGDENDNDPGDGGDNSLSDELFAKTNLKNVVVTDESSGISSINADEMDKFIEALLSNFGINPTNIGDPNYTDAVNKANGIYDLVLAYIRSFDYGSETADSIIDTMEKSMLSNLNLVIPKLFNSAMVGTNEDELFKTDMTKTHLGTFMYYTAGTEKAFTSYFEKNKSLNKNDVKLTLFRLDNGAEVEVSLNDIKEALNRIKQALNEMSGITSRSIEDGSATKLFNKLLDASTEINISVSVLQDGKLIRIGDLYGGILRQLASEGKANAVKEYENDPSEVINLAHDREHLLESIVNALEDAMSLNSSVTEEDAVKNIGVSDLRIYFPTLDGDKEPSNSEGSPIGVGVIDMNENNVYMPGEASYDSRQTVFKSVDGKTMFTMNSVKIGRQEFAVRLKSNGEGYDTVVFNGSNIGMFNGIDPTDRDANRDNAIRFVKHLMTLFAKADREWFNDSLEYLNRFMLVENLHEDLASIRDAYEKMIERGANEDDTTTVMFNGKETELSLKQARKILDDNSYGASIEIIPNMNRDDSAKSGLSKSLDFVVHYIDDEDGSRRTFTARFDENTINKIVSDFDNSNIDDKIANMAIDLYTAVTTRMAFNLNKGNFTSNGLINNTNSKIDSDRAPYDTESGKISFIPGIFEFNTKDHGGYDSASKLTIAQMMQRSGAFVCGAKLDDGGHVQKSSIPKVYVVSGSCNLKFTRQGGADRNVISLNINGGTKAAVSTKPRNGLRAGQKAVNVNRLSKDGYNVNPDTINGLIVTDPTGHSIFTAMGRTFILCNINGNVIPFYQSSRGTSGKVKGDWYPFFGYTGNWLIKGAIVTDDGKMPYSPEIDRVAELLNRDFRIPTDFGANGVSDSSGLTVGDIGLSMYTVFDRFSKDFEELGNRSPEALQFWDTDNDERTNANALFVREVTGIDAPGRYYTGNWLDFIKQFIDATSVSNAGASGVEPASDDSSNMPVRAESTDAQTETLNKLNDIDKDYSNTCSKYPRSKFGITSVSAGAANKTGDAANNAGGSMKYIGTIMDSIYRIVIEDIIGDSGVYSKNPTAGDILKILTDGKSVDAFVRSLFNNKSQKLVAKSIKYIAEDSGMSRYDMVKVMLKNYIAGAISAGYQDPKNQFFSYIETVTANESILNVTLADDLSDEQYNELYKLLSNQVSEFAQQISDNISNILAGAGVEFGDIIKISDARCVTEKDELSGSTEKVLYEEVDGRSKKSTYDGPKVLLELTKESIGAEGRTWMPDRILINGEADIIIVKKDGTTIVSDFKVIAGNDSDETLTGNIDEASSSSDGKYFNQLNIERLGLEQKGIKVRDKSMSIIATEVAPITKDVGVVSFRLRSNNDNKPRIIPVPDGKPKVNIDGQVFEISDTKPPVEPSNAVVDAEDDDNDNGGNYFNTGKMGKDESFGSGSEVHYRAKASYSLNDNPVDLAIVKTDEYGRSYIDIEDAISYIRSTDSIKYSILKRIVNAAMMNGVSRIDITDMMKAFGSVRVRRDGSLVDVKLSIDRDALRDRDCFANTLLHELIHASLIGIDTLSASSSASDLYSKYIDYMNQSDSVKAASIKQIITNFDEFLAEGGNDYTLGSFVEWAKANNVQLFGGSSMLSKVCNALISLIDKILGYLGVSDLSTRLAKKVVMYEILRFIDTNRDGSAKNNVAEGITIINRSNNNQIIGSKAVVPFAILDGTNVKLGLANVLGIDSYDDDWFARNSEKIRQSAFLSSILSVYRTTNNIESLRSRLIGRDGNGLMKAIDDAINGEEISNKSAARVIKLLDTYLTVCGFHRQSNGTFVNYVGELEAALDDVFKAVNESGDKKPASVLKVILSNDRLKSVAKEMSSAVHAIAENSAQDGNLETAALRGDFDGMISINNGLSITERFKEEPHFDVHTLDVIQNITSSIGGIYSSYKNFKTRSDIALAMKSICSPALKDMYFGGSLEFSITASRIIQIIDEQAKVVLDRVTSNKDSYSSFDIKILENLADIRNNILSGDEYTKQIVIDAIADIESKITVIRDEHRADTLQDVIQYSEKDIDPMLSMSPRLKLLLSLIPKVDANLWTTLAYNQDTGMPEMWDTERVYRILSNISSNERTSGAPGFSTFDDFVDNLCRTRDRSNTDPETDSVVLGMLFMIKNSTFFESLDSRLKEMVNDKMPYPFTKVYSDYEAKNSRYKMREQDLALILSFMNRDILESENISVAKGGILSRSSGSGNFTKNTVKIANDNALQMLLVEVGKTNPSIKEYDPSDANCMAAIRGILKNIKQSLGVSLSTDALYDSLVKIGFVSVNKSDITQGTSSNFRTILEKSISLIEYALTKDETLVKATTDDIDQTDLYMSAPYRRDLYDANGKFKKPRRSTDLLRFTQNQNVSNMQYALSAIGMGRAMMSTPSTRNAKGERIQLDKASNFIESHFRKVKRDVKFGGKTGTVTDEYKRNFDCGVSLSTSGGIANSIYEFIEDLEISHDGPMEDSRAGSTTKKNDYADRNAIDLICSKFKNILNGCVVLPTMSSNGYCEKIRDIRGWYARRTFLYSLLNNSSTGVSIGSRGYRELAKRALIEVASARRESEIAASIIKGKEVGSDSYKGYHYIDDDKKGRLIGPCATLPRFGSIYFTMDHDLGRKNEKGDTIYDKKTHKLDLNKIINNIINSSLDINTQTEMLNKVYDLAYAVYSSSVLTTNSNDDTVESIDNAVKSITKDSRFNGIVDGVDTQVTQLNDFISKLPRDEKSNTGLAANVNIFRTLLRLLANEDLNTLVRNGAVVIDESGQVQLNTKLPDLDSEVPVRINEEALNISLQDIMNDPSNAGTGGLLGLKKYLDIVELFGLIGLVDFENFFASQPNMFKNQVDQTKRYQSYMSTGTEPCVIRFNDDINREDNDNDGVNLKNTRIMRKALSSTEFKYASMKDVAVGETDNGVFNTVVDVDNTYEEVDGEGNKKVKYHNMTMRAAFKQYAENLYSEVKNGKHRKELVESFVKIRMDKLSGNSIASSDGACFITMDGLRKYLIKEGRWSADKINDFFDAVNKGTAKSRPELREMYINIVLSPMKLIYTGMTQGARIEVEPSNPDEEGNTVRRDSGATKVRVMKMAVFPLLPSMLKEGTVGARLAKIAEDSGAELIGDNEIEKVGGLDSQTLFEQSKKKEINGENGAVIVDKNVGKEVVKIPTISINAQFLRRQMETNPHEDDIRKLGTQMMFQTISDLCDTDENGDPIDTTIRVKDDSSDDGKYVERSGRKMVDGIFKKMNNLEKAECRKILDSWVTTVNGVEAISVSKLKAILESTAIEHALGSDVISEIKRLGGEEYVPLSMLVRSPLFQAKIMAIVRSSAQSLSSNGGSFIQVPQTIFRAIGDNSTRLELVNEHGSMDCIISINAFKSILDTVDWTKYRSDNGVDPNKYGSKYNDSRFYTFEEAKNFLTENNIIGRKAKPISVGYRIPTQSKASISSLRVMDVVGAECGDMIVMPDGYVNITGSDFDIDKLYVATKSFTVISDADGKQVVVPIKTYLDKLIKSKETASPDKINQIQIEINKIEALSIASDIIDDYLSIITSPDQFVDTHTTIDSGTKLFKDPDTGLIKRLNTTFTGGKFKVSLISVVNKETGETKEETAESSVYENSISYQINKKLENAGAKFGIGPFAKASVNHVLAQIAGLKLSKEAAALLGVKSLGRIKSRDNVKISDWISYFINAHVDAAKDPYILDFNINKTTWSAACLMLRAGFGEQTLYVLSQESIRTFAMANELASACAVSDDRVRQSKSVRRDNLINEYISGKIEGILNTFYSTNKKTGSYSVNDSINIPEDMRLILDHMFTTYNEEGEAINGLFTKKGKYWAIDNKFVKNNQEVASKIFNIFLGNGEPSYIEKNGKVHFANNSTRLLQAMSDISTSGKSSIKYKSDSNGNESTMTRSFNDVYQLALLVAFQSVNSIGKSLDTVVNTCQVEQGGTGTNYYEFKRYLDGISDAINESSDDIENVTDMYRKTHLLDKILDISGVTTKIMAGTSVAATPNALALYENVLAVTGNKFNYGRRVSNGIFSAIENESLIRAFNIDENKVRLALGATVNDASKPGGKYKFDLRLEFNKIKSEQSSSLSQNYGLTYDEINALSNLYVGGVIVNGVNVPVMSKSSIDIQVSEIELIKSALDKLYRNKKTKALVENIVLNSLYTEGLIQSGSGVFNILCPWCAYILKDLTLKDGEKTNLKTVSEKQMDVAQYDVRGDRMFGVKAGVYRFILKYGFINDLIYRHTHDGKDWSVPFEMNKPFVINGKIRYESLPTMFTSTDSELRSKMFVKMSNKGRTKLYMKMLVYNRGSEIPTPTKEKVDISSIEDGIPERRITFKDRKDSKSKSETYVFVEVPADYSRNGASVVQNTSIVSQKQRDVKLRDLFEKVINSTGDDLTNAVMEYISYLSNEFKNDADSVIKNTTVAADDPELKYLKTILEWSNENKKLMPLATKIKNADKTNVNSFFSIEYNGDSMSIPYGGNSNIDTSTGYDELISKFADIYIKNLMPNEVVYKGKKETIQDMYMTLNSILNTMSRGNIEVSDSSPFVNGSVTSALNDVSKFVTSVYADADVDIDMCDNIFATIKAIERKCSAIVEEYMKENCL